MILCACIVYAQENNSNDLKAENTPVENKSDTTVKKKPDFNKKKISLDRIEEKKWSLRAYWLCLFFSKQPVCFNLCS